MNAPAMLPTERQVQRAILKMAGTCFPAVFIHHSPNGSYLAGDARSRQVQGGILMGDGTKKGFPDLLCLWAPGKGCLIEVKRPKLGVLSDAQKLIHERLTDIEWPVTTATSTEEAYHFLIACGAPCKAPWQREPF